MHKVDFDILSVTERAQAGSVRYDEKSRLKARLKTVYRAIEFGQNSIDVSTYRFRAAAIHDPMIRGCRRL